MDRLAIGLYLVVEVHALIPKGVELIDDEIRHLVEVKLRRVSEKRRLEVDLVLVHASRLNNE